MKHGVRSSPLNGSQFTKGAIHLYLVIPSVSLRLDDDDDDAIYSRCSIQYATLASP